MLEQHSLDRDDIWAELRDQLAELALEFGEPDRPIQRRVGADDAGRDRPRRSTVFHTSVAAARQTGIDSEDEHLYDPSRGPPEMMAPLESLRTERISIPWSSRRRLALLFVAVAVVVIAVLTERWFVHPRTDDPGTADAVFVLGGGGDRIGLAVDLARQGVSTDIVFAAVYVEDQLVWSTRPCNHYRPPDVPETAVFRCAQPDPLTTRGEARLLADLADQEGWDEVVVVASTDQITRARRLISRCWDGEVRMVSVDHSDPWPIRALYEWGASVKATFLRAC